MFISIKNEFVETADYNLQESKLSFVGCISSVEQELDNQDQV